MIAKTSQPRRLSPAGGKVWASVVDACELEAHKEGPAKAIDVSPRRIGEIVHRKRGISADTAPRLSRALGLTDMFFINMPAHYDAEIVREHLATQLANIDRIA